MVRQQRSRARLTDSHYHCCDEPNTLHFRTSRALRGSDMIAQGPRRWNAEWHRCSGAEYTPRTSHFQRELMTFLSRYMRPATAVAAAVIVWAASVALVAGQAPQPAVQLSDQVFKNIQVLKGLPVDEFMGTMGLFSAALTVCCGDCHTGAGTSNPKWEDDPPKKRTARRMMQMVAAINRDNFNGRQVVTCWTCHRGSERPMATPPLDKMYGEPTIEPPDIIVSATSGEPTVDQIFDKYTQALGGAQRLAALTSYSGKGTAMPY